MKKIMFILLSSISVYSQDYNNVISFDEVLSDVSEYINLAKSPNEIKENAKRLGLSILDIKTKNGIPYGVTLSPIGSGDYGDRINGDRINLNYYYGGQTSSSSPTRISFDYDGSIILKGTKHKAVGLIFKIESDGNISSFEYKPYGIKYRFLNTDRWRYELRTIRTKGDFDSLLRFVTNDTISLCQLTKINGKYRSFRDVKIENSGDDDNYSYRVNYYDLENEKADQSEKIKIEYWVSKKEWQSETLEKNTSFIENISLYLLEREESKYNRVDDHYRAKSYLKYIPQYKVYDYSENEFYYPENSTLPKKTKFLSQFRNPILERATESGDTLFYLNSKDFKKILNDGMIKRYERKRGIDNDQATVLAWESIFKNGSLIKINYYRFDEYNYINYLFQTSYYDTNSTKNKITVNDLYGQNYTLADFDESSNLGNELILKTVKNYKSGYIMQIKVEGSTESFDDGYKLNENFIIQKLVSEINQNNKEETSENHQTKIVETSENNQTKIVETSEKENNTEERQRYQEMLIEYNETLEKDPNNGNIYYNIGVANYFLGNITESKENIKKAIDLKPNFEEYYSTLLGLILENEVKIIEEMNSLGNSATDNLRYVELKEKIELMYKESIPIWKGWITLDESNLQALKGLQNIYSTLGDSSGFMEMKEIIKKYE